MSSSMVNYLYLRALKIYYLERLGTFCGIVAKRKKKSTLG